eukprot:GHVL01019713.1.p1 GENE.GHVL01019713.1~~GHVL01019713.1.p1  ORF type:complete len:380 (+),score=65.07 GHVL01019713.1:46-1185(+)
MIEVVEDLQGDLYLDSLAANQKNERHKDYSKTARGGRANRYFGEDMGIFSMFRKRPGFVCTLCGDSGHLSSKCPHARCFKCYGKGHTVKCCRGSSYEKLVWSLHDQMESSIFLSKSKLSNIRCMVCGIKGHVNCSDTPYIKKQISCYWCGSSKHRANDCRRIPESRKHGVPGTPGDHRLIDPATSRRHSMPAPKNRDHYGKRPRSPPLEFEKKKNKNREGDFKRGRYSTKNNNRCEEPVNYSTSVNHYSSKYSSPVNHSKPTKYSSPVNHSELTKYSSPVNHAEVTKYSSPVNHSKPTKYSSPVNHSKPTKYSSTVNHSESVNFSKSSNRRSNNSSPVNRRSIKDTSLRNGFETINHSEHRYTRRVTNNKSDTIPQRKR